MGVRTAVGLDFPLGEDLQARDGPLGARPPLLEKKQSVCQPPSGPKPLEGRGPEMNTH